MGEHVEGLSDAENERLERLIDEARRRQAAALSKAIDDGLGHLPRLVRVSVKAVLFR